MGLDVRNVIRPPLIPHRLGLGVSIHQPGDAEEALSYLTEAAAAETPRLSPRAFWLLRRRDVDGRYPHPYRPGPDRSTVTAVIVADALDKGYGKDWLCAVLTDPRNVGGAKLQEIVAEKGEREARRYLGVQIKEPRHRARRRRSIAASARRRCS